MGRLYSGAQLPVVFGSGFRSIKGRVILSAHPFRARLYPADRGRPNDVPYVIASVPSLKELYAATWDAAAIKSCGFGLSSIRSGNSVNDHRMIPSRSIKNWPNNCPPPS